MNGKASRAVISTLLALVGALALSSVLLPATANAKFGAFERLQAANSAIKWNDSPYVFPLSDCTFYVSSALWDGGLPSTSDWTPKTSDTSKLASKNILNPGPSKAAASANEFAKYMKSSKTAVVKLITWSDNTAAGAELADVIAFDWDGGANIWTGSNNDKTEIDHLAIVTGFTDKHYPLVSQHSPTRLNRYWSWDEGSNNWIEFSHKGARAYLIHFV
ncbi:amidase domain-containing protein [Nocardia salmonicida]|uniref:amidase domain-containing protein n=1 Tax=Nocardia salmonicida TaxID=53431 RepID=UPI000A01FA65|nr:amidase domain-containing protein [Nocardia salmonicida]